MNQSVDSEAVHLALYYTEDSSGGVALLEAQKRYLEGKPKNLDFLTDIKVVPLYGHHGYKEKLFDFIARDVVQQRADAKIRYGGCEVEVEVWVNVDADKMSKYGVTPEDVARMASEYGYYLAVNRENLEGEVLRMLPSSQESISTSCLKKINEVVFNLNQAKGKAANEAMKLPKYDKNGHASEIFFERLTVLYPDLLEQYIANNTTNDGTQVKTIADLLKRSMDLYP